MGVASGIAHLFESIVETIRGIFAGILHLFGFCIDAVVGVFTGCVNFIEGTLGFAIHNFFILGTIAALVFGYILYTQRQGTAPVGRRVKS
ncbi:hypothetical protein F4808DRAFT_128149 [Astrocystis sublimbata]|nr:hypothetical protein F4808DRAFT_128149 [Astrocystis sublimbata]